VLEVFDVTGAVNVGATKLFFTNAVVATLVLLSLVEGVDDVVVPLNDVAPLNAVVPLNVASSLNVAASLNVDVPLNVEEPLNVAVPATANVFPVPTFKPTDVPVPSDLKMPSKLSKFVFNFVPQLSADAPGSGFVNARFVVVVSAMISL
jgi:hypothetical protein